MTKVFIDRALIEQAVEFVRVHGMWAKAGSPVYQLAKELRAALAEPAVEPVAYRYKYLNFMGDEVCSQDLPRNGKVLGTQALYTSPPPPAEPSIPNHQASLLAHALAECIVASGIVRKDIAGFSAPQLLLFAGDLKRMLDAQEAERALQKPPPAEPARTSQDVCTVPLLSDEEILQLTPMWFKKYTDGVLLGHARAIEQLVHIKFRTEFMK